MSSSDTIIQAILNRIAVRSSSGLSELATKVTGMLDNAPEKLREEWDLFQKEVIDEVDRIENTSVDDPFTSSPVEDSVAVEPQEKLDQLRAKVSKLNVQVEAWR